MKLKLAPSIINLVSNFYAGRKSEQFLQCSIRMREISEDEILQFREAAKQSETILIEYKHPRKRMGCLWMKLNN